MPFLALEDILQWAVQPYSAKIFSAKFCEQMAGVTGLEPAASGVTGRRSNQLSYTPSREIVVAFVAWISR